MEKSPAPSPTSPPPRPFNILFNPYAHSGRWTHCNLKAPGQGNVETVQKVYPSQSRNRFAALVVWHCHASGRLPLSACLSNFEFMRKLFGSLHSIQVVLFCQLFWDLPRQQFRYPRGFVIVSSSKDLDLGKHHGKFIQLIQSTMITNLNFNFFHSQFISHAAASPHPHLCQVTNRRENYELQFLFYKK